jgi:hypothetical protein
MKEDDTWNDVDSGWADLEEVIDSDPASEPAPKKPEQPIIRSDSGEFSEEGDTVNYTEEEVPEEVVAFLGHRPEPQPREAEEPAPQVVLSLDELARGARSEASQTDEEPPTVPGSCDVEDQTAPYPAESLPEELSEEADREMQDWTGPTEVMASEAPPADPVVEEAPGYSMVVLALLALTALVSVAAVVYFVCFS